MDLICLDINAYNSWIEITVIGTIQRPLVRTSSLISFTSDIIVIFRPRNLIGQRTRAALRLVGRFGAGMGQ